MKQEEINEGSRIIALFMGFTEDKSSLGNTLTHPDLMGVYGGVGMKLKYHTSWDWLMPVVEKIEKMGFIVAINTGCVDIAERGEDHSDLEAFVTCDCEYNAFEADAENKITALYRSILNFIKWYNSQQPC